MTQDPSKAPPRLSIAWYAETYGISKSLIWLEISRGHIRTRKIGRRTIILPDDWQAFLDRDTQQEGK